MNKTSFLASLQHEKTTLAAPKNRARDNWPQLFRQTPAGHKSIALVLEHQVFA